MSPYQVVQAWYERMRTRPIMTGAYLRPTLYNGPLPRLVPQPAHITGMITWRRKARERRQAKFDGLVESTRLLGSEAQFERELSQLVSQRLAAKARAERVSGRGCAEMWRDPFGY